jgi:hypothetical protein
MASYADAIKRNDSVDFQRLTEQKLLKAFNKILESIEIEDDNCDEGMVLSDIKDKCEELNATESTYMDGIATVVFDAKDSALEFADFLDELDGVDAYELSFLHDEGNKMYRRDDTVDFEDIEDGEGYEYEFLVELNPDIVNYCSDDEFDELEEGAPRKIKSMVSGKVGFKFKCKPGQKNVNGHCVAMKSAEKANRGRAALRGAKKRKGMMGKIRKKMAKTNALRQAKGLD